MPDFTESYLGGTGTFGSKAPWEHRRRLSLADRGHRLADGTSVAPQAIVSQLERELHHAQGALREGAAQLGAARGENLNAIGVSGKPS